MNISDYNRVLWGIWQQAWMQEEWDESLEKFSFCQTAWDIFLEMDARSSPLFMSRSEIRQQPYWTHIYDVDVRQSV